MRAILTAVLLAAGCSGGEEKATDAEADADADADTDADADADTDTDSGVPVVRYAGPFTLQGERAGSGDTGTCEGTAALTVTGGVNAVGNLTCAWQGDLAGEEDMSGTLDGEVLEDAVTGTYGLGDLFGDWQGTYAEDAIEGGFAGSGALDGETLTYDASFSLTPE